MIKRGEIYYVHLNPTVGSEINKIRPVVVVSNNAANKASTITIVPLTSKVDTIYPFEVFLSQEETSLKIPSKAQCHQVRTISKQRLSSGVSGIVSEQTMTLISGALKLHLGL